MSRRAALLAIATAACTSDGGTRLRLEIASTAAIDQYELAVGTRSTLADPLPELDVELPDAMAGELQTVDVWGLAANQQVAFGSVSVVPVLHQTVGVGVALAAIACGTPCTAGETVCANGGTITCAMDASGCLAWSPMTPCPSSAPECSNGTCAATCTDECSPGQTECDTAFAMRTCGQFDGDPCLDWSPPTACASGQTCSTTTCSTMTTATTPLAPMPSARENVMAVTGSDGTIYAIGGDNGSTAVATVDAYSPSTNTWKSLAPLPVARTAPAVATALDGTIYVFGGGEDATGEEDFVDVDAYDAASNSWVPKPNMPTGRYGAVAVTVPSGLIYVMGGMVDGGPVATVDVFDPADGVWTPEVAMPAPTVGFAASLGPDGKIYVYGGGDLSGSSAATWSFDLGTHAWTTMKSLPLALEGLAGVTSGSLIYEFGGMQFPSSMLYAQTYAFDPHANTWIAYAAMPAPRAGHAAAVSGGIVYVMGGMSTTGILATVEAYDPATNTWR